MATHTATISKEELQNKIAQKDRFQLVNVLGPEHYHLGMIPGSRQIPEPEINLRASELDPDQEIIVYCAGYECPLSRQAADKLASMGYNVRAYEGGIQEWNAEKSSGAHEQEVMMDSGHMFRERQ